MSVVNKMLQDLEARQVNSSKVSADYQPPTKSLRWLWWLIIMVAVLLLAVLYWLSTQGLFSAPAVEKNNPISASAAPGQTNSGVKLMRTNDKLIAPLETSQNNTLVETEASDIAPGPETAELAVQSATLTQTKQDWLESAPAEMHAPEVLSAQPKEAKVAAQPAQIAPTFAIKDSSQASQSSSLKQQISDALAGNDNSLAMRLLSELLEQQPDNFEALKKLASLLFADGQISQASNRLLAGVQNAPERGDLRLMLARLYIQQQQPDLALALLQELNSVALPVDYLAFRANLAQQQADYASAHQDYLRLTRIDESNARWWLGLGITEEKRGANAAAALQAYQRAQNLQQLEPAVSDFIAQRIKLLAGTP